MTFMKALRYTGVCQPSVHHIPFWMNGSIDVRKTKRRGTISFESTVNKASSRGSVQERLYLYVNNLVTPIHDRLRWGLVIALHDDLMQSAIKRTNRTMAKEVEEALRGL